MRNKKIVILISFFVLCVFFLLLLIPQNVTPKFLGKLYLFNEGPQITYKDLKVVPAVFPNNSIRLYPYLKYHDDAEEVIDIKNGQKTRIDKYSVRSFFINNPFAEELSEGYVGGNPRHKFFLYIKG